MKSPIDQLASGVLTKLRGLGFSSPNAAVIRELLRVAYEASLTTEEGRFVRGSITYADPANPDRLPPLRRADYPTFTKFSSRRPLTTGIVVKLSRAIDNWSASIAVWGASKNSLSVWGVLDQLVSQSRMRHREGEGGFSAPGIVTVNMDGVGDVSVYQEEIFLGAIRSQRLVVRQADALRSHSVAVRVLPYLEPIAGAIAHVLEMPADVESLHFALFEEWANTVARLCIGLRRLGTGGTLLITPSPVAKAVSLSYRLPYSRLGDSVALKVLDELYLANINELVDMAMVEDSVSTELIHELGFADVDAEDRRRELSGAIKMVTSLASMDGALVLNPNLHVLGLGAKIGSGPCVLTVYDGPSFSRRKTAGKRVSIDGLGTRHASAFRYCRLDPAAVAVVVSQDGQVRLVVAEGQSVVLWEDVSLLDHQNYSRSVAAAARKWRKESESRPQARSRGYTSTPKTIKDLLRPA